MKLFDYEWKKTIPQKVLLFIPIFYIYSFIDLAFVQNDNIWGEWFISYTLDIKILCIILIFLLSPVFSREKEVDMLELILTSKNGVKKLPKIKLLVGFSLTNILTLLFCIISYISFGIGHSTWNWGIPIEDMALYRFIGNPGLVTYQDMRNQVWLNSFLALNLVAAFVLLVSAKSKQSLRTAIIAILVNFIFSIRNIMTILRTDFGKILIESFPINLIWNEMLNEKNILFIGKKIQIIYIIQVLYIIIYLVLYKLICTVYQKK